MPMVIAGAGAALRWPVKPSLTFTRYLRVSSTSDVYFQENSLWKLKTLTRSHKPTRGHACALRVPWWSYLYVVAYMGANGDAVMVKLWTVDLVPRNPARSLYS